MSVESLSRRAFVGTATGLAAGAVLAVKPEGRIKAPAIHIRPQGRNAAVASGNGLPAMQKVGELLAQGVDTLDAAIEGVKIQELDPDDTSVG